MRGVAQASSGQLTRPTAAHIGGGHRMRGRTGGMAAGSPHVHRSRRRRRVAVAGTEPQPGTSQAAAARRRDHRRSCTPQNPLIPANTNEACGGDICRRHRRRSWCTTTPTTPRRSCDIAESIETKDNQTLHGQAQAGLQVPRRHRGQGQELRRRLELDAYGPNGKAEQLLLRADRGLRRPAVRHRLQGRADCKASRRRPRR